MRDTTFSGVRLQASDGLFAVDLARHRAAYEYARNRPAVDRLLDLGCGSGYGTRSLAEGRSAVVGFDRIAPDTAQRSGTGSFVRGDLASLPFADASFARVVSFQVIEHFADPTVYLDALATLVRPNGEALITTPNRLTSDGVNPYHFHEYTAEELRELLARRFASVEILGIGASEPVQRYFDERQRRVARILRLDPFRLHRILPARAIEWLFASFAVLVRRRASRSGGLPEVTWRDYPVGPVDPDCLDLLAICREPISKPHAISFAARPPLVTTPSAPGPTR